MRINEEGEGKEEGACIYLEFITYGIGGYGVCCVWGIPRVRMYTYMYLYDKAVGVVS